MKKWIGYLAVGMTCFIIGTTLPSRQSSDRSQQAGLEVNRTSNSAQKRPKQDTPRIESFAIGTGNQLSGEEHLLNQLATIDPSIYERIQHQTKANALCTMLEELCRVNPAEAARLLANADDATLATSKTALYLQLAQQWSLTDPNAAYAWINTQKENISPTIMNGSLAYIAANMAMTTPTKAIELLGSISDKSIHEMTRSEIANTWVVNDHEGAFKWLESLSQTDIPNDTLNRYYASMMKTFISVDPFKAAQLVEQLDAFDLQKNLSAHVAAKLSQVNLQGAFNWVNSLSNEESRLAGIREIVHMQQSSHPEEVVNFLLTQPKFTAQTQHLLIKAFETLAFNDDAYAIDLLERLPKSAQPDIAESVTYGLLSKDERFAMEWINSQPPGQILDGAAGVMVLERIESDPLGAIEWANKITDQTRRNKLLRDLSAYARPEDLPAIQQSINRSNLSPIQRTLIDELILDRLRDTYASYVTP